MNARKNDDVSNGMSACEPALLFQFEQRCDELLEQGAALLASTNSKNFGYDELRRMLNRLAKYKDNYSILT
jgi:23S rRNA G2069 N7-methylase RlmK/C1962 C5-methylase RlmI